MTRSQSLLKQQDDGSTFWILTYEHGIDARLQVDFDSSSSFVLPLDTDEGVFIFEYAAMSVGLDYWSGFRVYSVTQRCCRSLRMRCWSSYGDEGFWRVRNEASISMPVFDGFRKITLNHDL